MPVRLGARGELLGMAGLRWPRPNLGLAAVASGSMAIASLAITLLVGGAPAAASPRAQRIIPLPVRRLSAPLPPVVPVPPPPLTIPPPVPPYRPPAILAADLPPRLLTAASRSGFCWDVPAGYRGNATRLRPTPDELTPACVDLGPTRGLPAVPSVAFSPR